MQKIIDSHVHIKGWGERDLVSCFDDYMAEKVETVNTCAIPLAQSNVANNILLALYKLARPNTYVHGGIELIAVPLDNMPEGMDAVTQYHELMDMGFDGIALAMGFASVGGIIIGAIFVKSGKWKNKVVGIK